MVDTSPSGASSPVDKIFPLASKMMSVANFVSSSVTSPPLVTASIRLPTTFALAPATSTTVFPRILAPSSNFSSPVSPSASATRVSSSVILSSKSGKSNAPASASSVVGISGILVGPVHGTLCPSIVSSGPVGGADGWAIIGWRPS